ncbi:MAG TPA: hypothetical protein VJ922_07025 [Actinomycetota bacterium]|nr:hypothetical protein [Actinomycetota bacterium]
MARKKDQLGQGDRVKVVAIRPDPEPGTPIPQDIIGLEGTIQWVTPGYAGDKGAFEIKLDDGRVFNLYATEIEPVEP